MKKIKSHITVFFVAWAITGCSMAYSGLDAETPDLNIKQDGVYRGTYKLSPVDVTLDVTIGNRRITEIEIIEHTCSAIGKNAEKITNNIIKKQSLNVDAVTGATISSKAILKAVENALQ